VDAIGYPLRLLLTAGQVHEVTQATTLIEGLTLVSLIADKGYDTDDFRTHLAEAEIDAVIPPCARRTTAFAYDEAAYQLRYRIECFINKIKHYRRIATRFEKTALSFFSMLCLAAAMIWLR
jgi:transposase